MTFFKETNRKKNSKKIKKKKWQQSTIKCCSLSLSLSYYSDHRCQICFPFFLIINFYICTLFHIVTMLCVSSFFLLSQFLYSFSLLHLCKKIRCAMLSPLSVQPCHLWPPPIKSHHFDCTTNKTKTKNSIFCVCLNSCPQSKYIDRRHFITRHTENNTLDIFFFFKLYPFSYS